MSESCTNANEEPEQSRNYVQPKKIKKTPKSLNKILNAKEIISLILNLGFSNINLNCGVKYHDF